MNHQLGEYTEEELREELESIGLQWDELCSSDEELGSGSPGEWMVERMEELETELRRRAL